MFLFFGIVAVAGSYFVQVEHLSWEAFALAVPVGLLAAAILVVNNVRDIDTDRRAGKRTLAVRLGRERTRDAVRRDRLLAPTCWRPVTWLFGPLQRVGAAAVADAAARRAGRPHRAQPHRRAVAEPGARPDRDAAARVLRAALGRAAAEPVKLELRSDRGALARAVCVGHAARSPPASCCCVAARGRATASSASARPRRCRATTASTIDDVRAALEDCRAVLARRRRRADASDVLAACARARGAAAGARRDRPRAVGPRRPARRRAGVAAARAPSEPGRSPSTRRSPPPTAPARPREAAPPRARRASAASRSRSGSATTPAGWPRSGPPPARRWRSGSTPTAPGRSTRRSAALGALEPVGIELCEEPVSGARARSPSVARRRRRAGRARRDAPRSRARSTRRVCDAVCLKIAALRRDHRPARRRAARARAAGYEVYLASTLDGPLGIAAALHAAAVDRARPRRAGWRRWAMFDDRDDPLPAARRARSRVPDGSGPRRRAARLVLRSSPPGARSRRPRRSGASRCTAWPGAGDDARPRARGIAARHLARRSRGTSRRARRRPASTGIAARRAGPTATAAPRCPSPRSAARQPRRRVAQPVGVRPPPATVGRLAGEHRGLRPAPRELLDRRPPRSRRRAARRRARRASRSAGSAIPGLAPIRTSRSHPVAAARAPRAARSGRPSSSRRA